MTTANIQTRCPRCLGTGIDDNVRSGDPPVITPTPCEVCAATGYTSKDKIDTTDIMDKLDKCLHRLRLIMNKLEIP